MIEACIPARKWVDVFDREGHKAGQESVLAPEEPACRILVRDNALAFQLKREMASRA